jgi:hypothetical protein
MPLSLSDAEYAAAVEAAAAPINPLQRDAFLKALAEELERHPVVGPACAPMRRRPAASLRRRRPQRNVIRAASQAAPGG